MRQVAVAGRPSRQHARRRWLAWCVSLGLAALLIDAGWLHAQEVPAASCAVAPCDQPSDAQAPGWRSRLALGVDVTVTVGPDDPYWFNYTDYDQNALRLFVGAFGASYAVAPWLDAVGEVRLENADRVTVSALYARIRPWRDRAVTISAGRVPPVFGAFARTRYGSDNPLISRPLGYQYLTTLRYDVVPISADSLLAVRGSGWLVRYPESRPPDPLVPAVPDNGVPLVSTSSWDTGVVAHFEAERVAVSAGVTVGTLSAPRVDDNNSGKQVVGRVEWRPDAAWTLGLSAATGAFVSGNAARQAGADGGRWPQNAIGLDAAFARDHFRVRGEVVFGSWRVPAVTSPRLDTALGSVASTLEALYRLHPRIDAAVRGDWLGFSDIEGTSYGGQPTPWDADVTRVEAGISFRLARRWRLKIAYQYDWRFGAVREHDGYPAAQVAFWF